VFVILTCEILALICHASRIASGEKARAGGVCLIWRGQEQGGTLGMDELMDLFKPSYDYEEEDDDETESAWMSLLCFCISPSVSTLYPMFARFYGGADTRRNATGAVNDDEHKRHVFSGQTVHHPTSPPQRRQQRRRRTHWHAFLL
jgi:hypothetical protein